MGLTQSASSQVFCLGCLSLSRTAEEENGRGLAFSGRHTPGTEPASELHSLVKSSAEMCSILFTCPFRSSLYPFSLCYVPQELSPICLIKSPLISILQLGQPIGSLSKRPEGGTRERWAVYSLPCPSPCTVATGWLLPLSEGLSSYCCSPSCLVFCLSVSPARYQRCLPISPSEAWWWKELATVPNPLTLHHFLWLLYTLPHHGEYFLSSAIQIRNRPSISCRDSVCPSLTGSYCLLPLQTRKLRLRERGCIA